MIKYSYDFKESPRHIIDAAMKIVPVVLQVTGPIKSLVDLGGCTGAWSSVFKRHGVEKIRCVDHPSIPASDLLIEPSEFVGCDLAVRMPQAQTADLAVCLECAEHLPAIQAPVLVDFLTRSAHVVLFSAAIPGQGGNGHINLRRAQYWEKLFGERGYELLDVLRPRIIFEADIPIWYRQNIRFFADPVGRQRLHISHDKTRMVPADFEIVSVGILNSLPSFTQSARAMLDVAKRKLQRLLRAR